MSVVAWSITVSEQSEQPDPTPTAASAAAAPRTRFAAVTQRGDTQRTFLAKVQEQYSKRLPTDGEISTEKDRELLQQCIRVQLAADFSVEASIKDPDALQAIGILDQESVSYTHLTLPTTPYV